MPARRLQQSYDHRLRQLVQDTGDVTIATRVGVPRSTASGWLRRPTPPPVTLDLLDMDERELQAEVVRLRRQVERLLALLRLVVALVRACGVDLTRQRVPDGRGKTILPRTIERSRDALPLRRALRLLRLAPSRYYAWRRGQRECELDDRMSCPQSTPHQLTPNEVRAIKDMVTSSEFRHVPTGRLATLAQRLGRVFASSSTWYRLIRVHGWRRPRLRVHPAKPKVGIRATNPNEVWHIDTTIIKLLDGRRGYLHAIIDNYSRRILSWRLSDRFDPGEHRGRAPRSRQQRR